MAAGAVVIIPEDQLAREIEFAIAYTAACNPAVRPAELLSGRRAEFADLIADLLIERAAGNKSGMTVMEGTEAGP